MKTVSLHLSSKTRYAKLEYFLLVDRHILTVAIQQVEKYLTWLWKWSQIANGETVKETGLTILAMAVFKRHRVGYFCIHPLGQRV
jgi:hypothetical protein